MRALESSALKAYHHLGGKLRELGPASLSEQELLAVLISTGVRGKSALDIAKDILDEFGSLKGLSGEPLERFLRFKGLSDVKIIRIAAALEIARRVADEVSQDNAKIQTT
jgi:DNA repair protein RadC